jgi:hypothetical protein
MNKEELLNCGHPKSCEATVPPFDPELNGSARFWTRDMYYCTACYEAYKKRTAAA